MADIAYRIQAYVVLREGMRLLYNSPRRSFENFATDHFYRKYRGRTAVIVGFPTVPVPPYDPHGRLPGMYLKSRNIDVRFDGEEQVHRNLSLSHFVLLDPTTTVSQQEYERAQRVGDLYLAFYPGDIVSKGDSPVPRLVQGVRFTKSNEPFYALAETSEAKQERLAAQAARREKAKDEDVPDLALSSVLMGLGGPGVESCAGGNLTLIQRGPAYFLYTDPSNFVFESAKEELLFWAESGLSTICSDPRTGLELETFQIQEAQRLVKDGVADLILVSRRGKTSPFNKGGSPEYVVRRLHDCYEQFRSRVRELTLSMPAPLPEREPVDRV